MRKKTKKKLKIILGILIFLSIITIVTIFADDNLSFTVMQIFKTQIYSTPNSCSSFMAKIKNVNLSTNFDWQFSNNQIRCIMNYSDKIKNNKIIGCNIVYHINSCLCKNNWQTKSWSSCINNMQTRTVTDLNHCSNITIDKPSVSQSCSIPLKSNTASVSKSCKSFMTDIDNALLYLPFSWKGNKCIQSYTDTLNGCILTYFDMTFANQNTCSLTAICNPNWKVVQSCSNSLANNACSIWNPYCINGQQIRYCYDTNKVEYKSCTTNDNTKTCNLIYGNENMHNINIFIVPVIHSTDYLVNDKFVRFMNHDVQILKNNIQYIYPFSNVKDKFNIYTIWDYDFGLSLFNTPNKNIAYNYVNNNCNIKLKTYDIFIYQYTSISAWQYMLFTTNIADSATVGFAASDLYKNDRGSYFYYTAIAGSVWLADENTIYPYNTNSSIKSGYAHEIMHTMGDMNEDYGTSDNTMWSPENTQKVLDYINNVTK